MLTRRAMAIDSARVRHIARLARVELSESEVARMAEELGRIVAYVDLLEEVAREPGYGDVKPTSHAVTALPLREDEPGASLDHEVALAEAPRAIDGGFAVPTFVGEG